MTRKRLRYSELAPAERHATPAPSAAPAASGSGALPAKRAPVELARALAAARAAEQQAAAAPAAAIPAAPAAPTAIAAPPAPAPAAIRAEPARRSAPLVSRALRDRVRARTGQAEILLFRIADERFGIELAAVEEAIDIPPVHHVPEMPPAMLGVITVRGMLTSVYSPAAALGLSLHDGTSALIFRRERTRLAVVVDEVDDVTTLDLSLLRDAPMLDAGDGIVLGVVRQRDALLALVDAEALLAACQAAPLLEIA